MKVKVTSPWNSPGQNTGVDSLSLLEGIFSTQGSNPGLQHYRQILYRLSHQGLESLQEENMCLSLSPHFTISTTPAPKHAQNRSQQDDSHQETSLAGQWIRINFARQGMPVPFVVGELRSHMPQGN